MQRWSSLILSGLLTIAMCLYFVSDRAVTRENAAAAALPASERRNAAEGDGTALRVYDAETDSTFLLGLEAYVEGVVASEMPALYDMEALKAQAVAARTFALHQSKAFGGAGCTRNRSADVCTSSGCCQAYREMKENMVRWGSEADARYQRISEAVTQTRGEYLAYEEKPIKAMYHASSGGHTENVEDVYSQALPYLRGVESVGEESYGQYASFAELTFDELKTAFSGIDGADLKQTLSLEEQLEILGRTENGRVTAVRVGLAVISGASFRRLTGIRSSIFEMTFADDAVRFDTRGYGHGVGMSQTGADAMAKGGANYRDILDWYFSDVTLQSLAQNTS